MRSVLSGLLPGARARRAQVAAFAEQWRRANEEALAASGPLWIVLGDSSAQAIGATAIHQGYVGAVLSLLRAQRDRAWRVVNLSRSGAFTSDVVAEQLPRLADLPPAGLVSCAAGSNDVLQGRHRGTPAALATIAAAMPPGSVLANMPRGILDRRAAPLNPVVRAEADRYGHRVADLWATTGPPWRGKFSADWFHPNDLGYEDWTRAFRTALDL